MFILKILLVDDERSLLDQASIFLKKINEDFEVHTLTSAKKAIKELKNNTYDAVISDYQMPVMDGLEFLKEFKERDYGIPFIIFTGKGREEVAIKALNLGADRYLQKGGNPKTQYKILAQAVEQEIRHFHTKRAVLETKDKIESLHKVSLKFNELKTKDSILEATVKYAEDVLAFDFCDLRVQDGNQMVIMHASSGLMEKDKISLPISDSIAGKSYKTKESYLTSSVEEDDDARPTSKDIRSAVTVPVGDLGVFQALSYEDNYFTEDDLKMTELLISHAVQSLKELEWKKKLESENELFESIMDRIPVMVTIYDPNMEHFRVNNEVERVLGFTNEDAEEMNLMEKVYPDDDYREMVAEFMREAKPEWRTFKSRTKDGRTIESSWTNIKLSDDRLIGIGMDKIEIKRMEKELEEGERLFHAIFNDENSFMGILDNDGTVLKINRSALDFIQAEPEEVEGELFWETPWWTHSEELQAQLKDAIKESVKGEVVRFEATHQADEIVYVDFSLRPVLQDGEVTKLIAEGKNINERKEDERKVKFQAHLLNKVEHAVVSTDTEGYITYWNEFAEELYGWKKDEVLGENIIDVTPSIMSKEDAVGVMAKLQRGESWSGEFLVKRKDGSEFTAHVTDSPLLNDEGELVGIVGVSHDISDRIELQEQLKESKERFQELFETGPDPAFLLDTKGRFQEINQAFIDKTGWGKEDVIGNPITDVPFLSSDGVEEAMDVFHRRTEGEEVSPYILEIESRDGDTRYVEINARVIKRDGESIGEIGIARDVTEKREVEMREDFLHSLLRHDVKNKMQIIKGYLELISEEEVCEEVRDFLNKISRATDESVDIINKVGKLRKLKETEVQEIRFCDFIDNVVKENSQVAEENGINLVTECDVGEGKVIGGPLLEETYENLIDNAIKHSGGSLIRISTESIDGEYVLFIEDNGQGLSDEKKDMIFERGFKNGGNAGSGLGTYLAKEIVESYGGSIDVKDSELGGLRFDVRLKKA